VIKGEDLSLNKGPNEGSLLKRVGWTHVHKLAVLHNQIYATMALSYYPLGKCLVGSGWIATPVRTVTMKGSTS
jgi:hypothetical protein